MPHSFFDLSVIILVASLAAVFMSWLKQLPMVGYVVAGVLLGPSCFNLIQSQEQIQFVAELGVVLLLFILGMELPLNSFRQNAQISLALILSLVVLG